MKPLEGIRLILLATNIPDPVAIDRLVHLGAGGFMIQLPSGDPLADAVEVLVS